MPLFADLAAMQARFEERDLIQLSDDDNSGGIDAARIDQCLVGADNLIKGYIAARHKNVESFAGNQLLADIACDYAFSQLWRSDPPDWVVTRRKDALKQLSDIAAGKIKLDDGQETADPRPGAIHVTSDPQRFGRDNLKGY